MKPSVLQSEEEDKGSLSGQTHFYSTHINSSVSCSDLYVTFKTILHVYIKVFAACYPGEKKPLNNN